MPEMSCWVPTWSGLPGAQVPSQPFLLPLVHSLHLGSCLRLPGCAEKPLVSGYSHHHSAPAGLLLPAGGNPSLLGQNQQEGPCTHNGLAALGAQPVAWLPTANLRGPSTKWVRWPLLLSHVHPSSPNPAAPTFCLYQEASPPHNPTAHVMLLCLCDYWSSVLSLGLVTAPAPTESSWKAGTISCLL